MGCGRRVSLIVSNSSAHPVAKEREIGKKVYEGFIVHGFFLSTVSVSSICLTGALDRVFAPQRENFVMTTKPLMTPEIE